MAYNTFFDTCHMQSMEGDTIAPMQENIQWIGPIHTGRDPRESLRQAVRLCDA